MIITIDGPSASGKSTLAAGLAKFLGYSVLHTGMIYRAMAKRVLGIEDKKTIIQNAVKISYDDLNDKSLDDEIVASKASEISKYAEIREFADKMQIDFSRKCTDLVVEGRDSGSVVFPDADIKFYINADVIVRAKRRYLQLKEEGKEVSLSTLLRKLEQRDEEDATRVLAPMVKPKNSYSIDTSNLTAKETIEFMLSIIKENFG